MFLGLHSLSINLIPAVCYMQVYNKTFLDICFNFFFRNFIFYRTQNLSFVYTRDTCEF